jgi:sirohydrochlorin ferrochelatase
MSNLHLREKLIKALLAHANGEIQLHLGNIDIYLANPVGIGEHPDVMAAIQDELDKIAHWHDQIEVIQKYLK